MTTATGRDRRAPSRPQLWRISERAVFSALRETTHRARRGPVTVAWLPDSSLEAAGHPRVAFAVGRAAGNAVVRNRIRRRLRAALRALQADARLPAGAYLIGARAEVATLAWPELCSLLDGVVAAATAAEVAR